MRPASLLTVLLSLCLLSGCVFKVKDTQGIKSMLSNKIEAEHLLSKVKMEYTGGDKSQILGLYDRACLENNKWIAGIQLDIQTKDFLAVSEDDYINSTAGKTGAQFIDTANAALGLSIITKGETTKSLINVDPCTIIESIIRMHNQKVEKARERIYNELEKAKWKTAGHN